MSGTSSTQPGPTETAPLTPEHTETCIKDLAAERYSDCSIAKMLGVSVQRVRRVLGHKKPGRRPKSANQWQQFLAVRAEIEGRS